MSAKARGIILGKEGEQLIIQASEADVVAFALGAKVQVEAAKNGKPSKMPFDMNDPYLYNKHGERVAYIESMQWSAGREQIDVTSLSSASPEYIFAGMPLPARYEITARGLV